MSKREKHEQMNFEQYINLLVHYKQLSPDKDIYINSKCINEAITMYNQLQSIKSQLQNKD